MFYDCSSLTTLNLTNFNTSGVIDMSSMFNGCNNLTTLDLSSFDTLNVSEFLGFVPNVSTLTIDYDSSKWNNDIVSAFSDVNWNDVSL